MGIILPKQLKIKTTVFVADIFALVVKGIKTIITKETDDYHFIGWTNKMTDLLQILPIETPDILIITHQLEDEFVTSFLPSIKACTPDTKIFMFTMKLCIETLLENIEHLDALVFKDAEIPTIIKALKVITAGGKYLSVV